MDNQKLINHKYDGTIKLINHLDLKWEEACFSPHQNKRSISAASQQYVRKKVYKGSSKAWLKYKPFLSGAFDELSVLENSNKFLK